LVVDEEKRHIPGVMEVHVKKLTTNRVRRELEGHKDDSEEKRRMERYSNHNLQRTEG
jgi:hypothetical protein